MAMALIMSCDRQRAIHKLTAITMDLPKSPLRRAVSFPLT